MKKEEFNSKSTSDLVANQQIRRFAIRASRSDLNEGEPRRRRVVRVPEIPRVKSEAELREEAAWKQVEELGEPVVLDDCLLLPKGMSVSKAIEFLPDDVRERTDEAWNAKLSEIWGFIFDDTEERIRKRQKRMGNWKHMIRSLGLPNRR